MPATLAPPPRPRRSEPKPANAAPAPIPPSLTPADRGLMMTLEEFEDRLPAEGWSRFELARGVLVVPDIPNLLHIAVWTVICRAFHKHWNDQPQSIHHIGGTGESRIIAASLNSGRHPDLCVYTTPAPPVAGREVWRRWIPTIVVEVISESTRGGDFTEKPEEYLQFGVGAYWIVDPRERVVHALARAGGRWDETILGPGDVLTTHLLPGFSLAVSDVFAAGEAAEGQ